MPLGFKRTARIIQPNIATADHLPRHVNVIILNENQIARQIAVFAQVNDLLNEPFAIIVARMGLAGKNELNGPVPCPCKV